MATYHGTTLEFTELLRATHSFTDVCRSSLHAFLYNCGHGSDWNTWIQLFGEVSQYFCQYSAYIIIANSKPNDIVRHISRWCRNRYWCKRALSVKQLQCSFWKCFLYFITGDHQSCVCVCVCVFQMAPGRTFTSADRPTWWTSPAGGVPSRGRTTSPTRFCTKWGETPVRWWFM